MKRILSLALAFAMLLTCTAFTAASAESSDTLVVLPYMTSENLNPYAGFSIDKVVRTQLFNSLWQYDENGQGVACLAESWEDSEDGTSITVHLRQDVTFSDGTPFNADAVVFTYGIAANSAALGYTTQSVISKVEKVDDFTVVLYKAAPYASVKEFCVEYLPIVSPTAYQADPEGFSTNPVGTGAYVLDHIDSATNYVYLTARDDYFEGTPSIKNIEVHVPLDSSVALVALENGEVQIGGPAMSNDDLAIAEGEGFVVENGAGWGAVSAMFFGEPYTSDENLRKALNYAINRENAAIYHGQLDTTPASDFFAKKLLGDMAGKVPAIQYDPEKAAEYLAQSNYNGEELEINVTSTYVNIATSIQADLAAIGVNTVINTLDANSWTAKIDDGTLGISVENWGVAYSSPEEMMGYFFNGGYYQGLGLTTSSDELNAELNAAASTWNKEEREAHTLKALELARDLSYLAPLFEAGMPFAHSANLNGCEPVWAGTYNWYLWKCSFAE